jgi:hypothetical protein
VGKLTTSHMLQPATLASIKTWGIHKELVVWDLPGCKVTTFSKTDQRKWKENRKGLKMRG